MKHIAPIFFFCILSFSQTNDSTYNNKAKKLYFFAINTDSLTKTKSTFNYKFNTNYIALFSMYNRNSKLNDVYYISNDSIYNTKIVNFDFNQFVHKDSFNPNGASNIGVGLIMGAINTVFNSIFK